jgi:hypothetical protein
MMNCDEWTCIQKRVGILVVIILLIEIREVLSKTKDWYVAGKDRQSFVSELEAYGGPESHTSIDA